MKMPYGHRLMAVGLSGAMTLLVGCQTWMGGMTLPSGRYLEHPPQYIPEDPDFPLTKELAYQEATAEMSKPGARAAQRAPVEVVPPVPALPLPPPLPPGENLLAPPPPIPEKKEMEKKELEKKEPEKKELEKKDE